MKKISFVPDSTQRTQQIIIFLFIIFLCLPGNISHADTGSNPKMRFDLEYTLEKPTIKDAKLMFCDDEACKTSQQVMGPFWCDIDYCSYNYGGNGYYKLIIVFSDVTRESNVFQKSSYDARYSVTVNQDDLQVDEQVISPVEKPGIPWIEFMVALVITVIIELIVAGVFLKIRKRSFKPVIIIIANLITVPIVWFAFPLFPLGSFVIITLSELFAMLFEAWFIQKLYKGLSFSTSFWLSLSMNLASFLIPGLLTYLGVFPWY